MEVGRPPPCPRLWPSTGCAALDNLLLFPKPTQATAPLSGLKEVKMQMRSPGFAQDEVESRHRSTARPKAASKTAATPHLPGDPDVRAISTVALALSVSKG